MSAQASSLTEEASMDGSAQGVAIEVAYFESDQDGFIERTDWPVVALPDVPLKDCIMKLSPILESKEQEEFDIICKGGNFKGEVIDITQKPLNIEYILNSLHTKRNPMLFVTRTKQRRDSGVSVLNSVTEQEERSLVITRPPSAILNKILQYSESDSQVNINQSGSDTSSEQSDTDDDKSDVFLPHSYPKHIIHSQTLHTFDVPPYSETTNVETRSHPKHIIQSQTLRAFNSETTNVETRSHPKHIIQSQTLRAFNVPPCSKTTSEELVTPPIIQSSRKTSNADKKDLCRRKAIRRSSTWDLNPRDIRVQLKSVEVKTEDGLTVTIPCHNYMTVGQLKQALGYELSLLGTNLGASKIILSYSLQDKIYELVDDSQCLITTQFLSEVATQQEHATGIIVHPVPNPSHKDLVILYRICQLTHVLLEKQVLEFGGKGIESFAVIAPNDRREVEAARRTLHDYVETFERKIEDYVLSVDISRDNASTTLMLKIPVSNRLPISFHYKRVFTLTREVDIHLTAETVLKDLFTCLLACDLVSGSVDEHTLQISGFQSYIHGNVELISFTDIRRCITKREPIHLTITQKPSALLHEPFSMSWLTLDPNSYKPPLQSDVSQGFGKDSKSIWECDEKDYFSLKLLKLENLPFTSTGVLSVEFSLHFGSELIGRVQATANTTQDSFTMKWNEEVRFCTKLRDLPKSTKILVIVRSYNSSTYFWGLIQVFDHSLLRTGDYTLHLWEAKREKSMRKVSLLSSTPILQKEKEAFSVILSSPAANNSSSNAVRAVISLCSHDVPIYYPSVSQQSRNILFKQHPWVRESRLKKHFNKYLEFKFSMTGQEPYHDLPAHLQKIHWASFKERIVVYEVLDNISQDIESVPLFVAFRLLDKDFPDEEVRTLATRVVECKVSSDTLEDYLLQLTQALKFEPNHDSMLARYLLKQALANRRIGHMFFWYIRCEMYNPQYKPRFAVILEAYLKGCGEEVLTKLMDQMTMQASLESIGQKLKNEFGKDTVKMQQALPQELVNQELQRVCFIPVYNPRLLLGGLRPGHCKIMPSAKKPMYLELVNVSPTVLEIDPVRLILKMGDDLRQDMMTLKMLSLFDKLWENEGLDLKLIPYGCMATGPKTGFIEVVKNSKTIAEVSGIRETKKLFEWIKSHQIDEFGEEDPQKLKAAINTFVHSCAGYSVATYILGIGDRHNDNIMITTSGNLFHIDFGHFLGNIKHFVTFKREWSPFVLTPDFTYVMGGEDGETFRYFKHLCIRAFLILRRNSDLIINLFSMMRSTGIPELTCVEDTNYIRTALALGKTDIEAERAFQKVIQKCLDLKWTVQVMWAIHKLKGATSPGAKNTKSSS